MTAGAAPRGRWVALAAALLSTVACEVPAQAPSPPVVRPASALPDSVFGALHARVSEPGGYFDTDNLISNETGYLNVVGVLERTVAPGGAYVGVGPDQNFSYVAALRPRIAFLVDIRRDNALHHLLLKALVERSPTRLEFLAALHGRTPPADLAAWENRDIEEIVDWIDRNEPDPGSVAAVQADVAEAVAGYGIPLTADDLATVRRFHDTFVAAGMGLRFTSLGRPPRPYYPTYRQLVLETDAAGRRASWLATPDRYLAVRDLHLANRIVPVVGDLAGDRAVREIGRVLDEMDLRLSAFYASNVEFYVWRAGTFGRWADNLAALPAADDAVVIRSYFPNFGGDHPSALPGYYATQTLQPVATVVAAREGRPFGSYWDVVTRDVLELGVGAGR